MKIYHALAGNRESVENIIKGNKKQLSAAQSNFIENNHKIKTKNEAINKIDIEKRKKDVELQKADRQLDALTNEMKKNINENKNMKEELDKINNEGKEKKRIIDGKLRTKNELENENRVLNEETRKISDEINLYQNNDHKIDLQNINMHHNQPY